MQFYIAKCTAREPGLHGEVGLMSKERGKNINMHWIKTINLLYALAFDHDQLMPQFQTSVHYNYISAAQYHFCTGNWTIFMLHAGSLVYTATFCHSASRPYHLQCTKTVGRSIYYM